MQTSINHKNIQFIKHSKWTQFKNNSAQEDQLRIDHNRLHNSSYQIRLNLIYIVYDQSKFTKVWIKRLKGVFETDLLLQLNLR